MVKTRVVVKSSIASGMIMFSNSARFSPMVCRLLASIVKSSSLSRLLRRLTSMLSNS